MRHFPPPDCWIGYFLAAVCALSGVFTETCAQVNYTGGTYQQSFDSLPSTGSIGSSIKWTNNVTLPGWYGWFTGGKNAAGSPTIIVLDDGSLSPTAQLYNYGLTNGAGNSTNRALGLLPGATPGNVMVGVCLSNTSAATYNSFTVTYTGEQWRTANTSQRTLIFAWAIGTPANLNDATVSWQANAYLNFISPQFFTNNGVPLNGDDATNQVNLANTVGGLAWAPGTALWLRFTNPNINDNQGLALDNFTFSASTNTAPAYNPVLGNLYSEAAGNISAMNNLLLTGNNFTTRQLPQAAYFALALNYPDPITAVATAQNYLNLMFTKQDTNPAAATYGQFCWNYQDTVVTDENATDFCFKPLAAILKRYAAQLGSNYVNRIKPMITNGLAAEQTQGVNTNYSNIYSMRMVNCLLLGEALPNLNSYHAGLTYLSNWVTDLGRETVHEYDSATYTTVTYGNLLIGANNSTNPVAADQLRSLANYLATDLSANYFNGQYRLGGSHSRDYDFVNGNGSIDHFYYLTGLQSKPANFGSFSDGTYLYINEVEHGSLPPLDVLAWGNTGSNLVVKSVWGPANTPGQDRYNFVTPTYCLGSSGTWYGSTQDKAIAADFTYSNALAQISVVYDPYDSPYGNVLTGNSANENKPNHLQFAAANVQDQGAILSLATLAPSFPAGKNFMGPYTNISTSVIFPDQAQAIYLNGAELATNSGNLYAATSGSVLGVQVGNTVMAARFYRVDGLDGYAPTYAVKFDSGTYDGGNAARFVAYSYIGPSTSFNNAYASNCPVIGVILTAGLCTNAAAVANFLSAVSNAVVTLSTNGTQATAAVTLGGTAFASTLDASSGAVISRKVNGTNYAPQMFFVSSATGANQDLFTQRFARMLGSGWIWTPLSGLTNTAAGLTNTSASYSTSGANPATTVTSYEPMAANPDAGGLVYRTFTGNAEILTRVNQQSDTSATSFGGVALRETLNPGACGAAVGFSGSTGVRLLWCATNSGPVFAITNSGFTAPGWLRLRRTGSVFSAAYRSDNGSWLPVGTDQTIVMNSTAYGGLAAAGGLTNAPATTVFSNAVGNSVFVPTPAAPTGFAASAIATNALALSWTDNATNETGFSLEISTNAGVTWNFVTTTPAGATSFTNSGLLPGAIYYYRLAAVNSAGASDYAYANAATWTFLQAWRQYFFGTFSNSGSAADTANPAGDGVPNLLKYALGANPLIANTNALFVAGRDGSGDLTCAFFRAHSDVTYIVQGSTNLQSWYGLSTNPGTVGQNCLFPDPLANYSQHFLRLEVTDP